MCAADARSGERGVLVYRAAAPPPVSEVCMDIQDAQREVRSVYIGGFWGQLVSSVIWLVSATLGTWVTPKASILAIVGGFFIFPLTQMLLRLSGRRTSASRANPFKSLGMQVAFVLPFSMLLLVPVSLYNLNWFFPALMVLLGAHFAVRYSLRDAHVPVPRGNSDRYGRRDRTLFFGNVQPWRMGRRTGPLRFRLDRACHRGRRSFRAFYSQVRLMARWDETGTSDTEIPKDCLSWHRFLTADRRPGGSKYTSCVVKVVDRRRPGGRV